MGSKKGRAFLRGLCCFWGGKRAPLARRDPSTSYAGPPPRSGEDLLVVIPQERGGELGRGAFVVAVTARFSREDWNRRSDYARRSRISLQALIEHGCSRILEDDGLKPLAAVVARHRDAKAA